MTTNLLPEHVLSSLLTRFSYKEIAKRLQLKNQELHIKELVLLAHVQNLLLRDGERTLSEALKTLRLNYRKPYSYTDSKDRVYYVYELKSLFTSSIAYTIDYNNQIEFSPTV